MLFHQVCASETDLGPEQIEELYEAQLAAMSVAARLDQQLREVAELLQSLGANFAVLKGSATANIDYPDPSWRQYGDIDVIVSERDRQEVAEALSHSGWRQGYPLPRGHERYAHAVTFTKGRRWELDLHQRVAHRAVGLRVPVSDLLRDRVKFEIAGTELWALSPTHRLLHAALHAQLSRDESRRLSSIADVLLLATRLSPLAAEVAEVAEGWRVRSIVERSILAAHEFAAIAVPACWLSAFDQPAGSRDRLIDAAYRGQRRHPVLEEWAHLRLMPSWTDRTAYLRGLILPGAKFARESGRHGRGAQARHLLSRLRDR